MPPCCRYFAGDFTDSSLHTSLSQPRKSHRGLHNHDFTGAPERDRLWRSCKCGRAVCLPPSYIAQCDRGTSLSWDHIHGPPFRSSPGSAAVTTLGRILQGSLWTRHRARSQETCLILKQIQPCNVQPTVITEADFAWLCSVPVCAGDRRNACPRDSSQMLASLASKCKLEVLTWPSRLRVKSWVACKCSLHRSKSLFILSHTRKERG